MLAGSRLALGRYPTPVERMDLPRRHAGLWIKRDDRTADLYGGNKVRKLERLLAAARDARKSRILTLGAVGSHQVVATAIYGAREGFGVEAVLVPQPASAHAERNLRVALGHGLVATACPAWSLAPAYLAGRWGHEPYFIPLGGSNVLGSLGFVDAARELAAQVRAGELEEPDVVVVATGSGGTAAGLAVGFELEGMKTRLVGVAVSPPTAVLRHLTRRLAQKIAAAVGLGKARGLGAAGRIDVEARWMGRGYGYPTAEGESATALAARASLHGVTAREPPAIEEPRPVARIEERGIALDPTYTAKAFACALSLATPAARVLYWHTLSKEPVLEPRDTERPLPDALARLLR